MSFAKYFASQLRKPSGFFGRYFIVRHLNQRNQIINSLALETLDLNVDDEVLEVGFGGGDLISQMAEFVKAGHITGVDFSSDVVSVCKSRFAFLIKQGKIDLQCSSIEELPLDSNKYSKVCSVNTIYFWPDPLLALRQIYRVLKEEGMFVLCFRPRSILMNRPFTQHGFILYEPDEIVSLFNKASFRNVRTIVGNDQFGQLAAVVGNK